MNMMKKLATLAVACLITGTAQAGEVIAHPGLEVSAGDVRDIFLGEKQLAGGTRLRPVENPSQQDAFLGTVLKMDAGKYQSLWTKKSFRDGVNAPPPKGGDAEVGAFVKGTPGAVGYVGSAPPGVKVLQKY